MTDEYIKSEGICDEQFFGRRDHLQITVIGCLTCGDLNRRKKRFVGSCKDQQSNQEQINIEHYQNKTWEL